MIKVKNLPRITRMTRINKKSQRIRENSCNSWQKLNAMLLTITTTYQPATDIGYLLHKHPAKVQSFQISCGQAHVFYPAASETKCTAALLLEVDPIGLIRNNKRLQGKGFLLKHYVNDRPYAASSFMSNAIAKVFSSALNGTCHARPELVHTPIPLEARISVLPCKGGKFLLEKLFLPLGYEMTAISHPPGFDVSRMGRKSIFYCNIKTQDHLEGTPLSFIRSDSCVG